MDPEDERAHAGERLSILNALAAAIERHGELLVLVADAGSADEAFARLCREWKLSGPQAQAVLDIQIRRFPGRERDRIIDERNGLAARIAELDAARDAG